MRFRSTRLLTDRAQEAELSPEIFEYFLKFRFYYQEFHPATAAAAGKPAVPASHTDMVRLYHQTEDAASEYDIPQCDRNTTAAEDCVHQITAHWQVKDMLSPQRTSPIFNSKDDKAAAPPMLAGVKIMFAGGHCHAPACISIELYNADTGKLICRQLPTYGTADHLTAADPYDERGYLALPPCVFGSEEHGLEPAVLLTWDTNLSSIKRNNATYGHYGEMASWQMRGYATN
eukprot:SAG22_NODE_326_length_12283_cov_248.386408_2_plen_231_part_00